MKKRKEKNIELVKSYQEIITYLASSDNSSSTLQFVLALTQHTLAT